MSKLNFSLCFFTALFAIQFNSYSQQTVGLFLNTEDAYDGYTLLGPARSDTTYLIDNCGNQLYHWTSTHNRGLAQYLLDNGHLLKSYLTDTTYLPNTFGGVQGGLEILDHNSNVVWTYEVNTDSEVSHHDVEVLPNGNILMIIAELIDEATATNNGCMSEAYRYSEKIIEINPSTNEIVWAWRAWDHLVQDTDPKKPNYGNISQNPQRININYEFDGSNPDWLHINSIDYNPELDQIMLSSPFFDEIWIIDHSTSTDEASESTGGFSGKGGDLLYRWGNPAAYNMGDSTDKVLDFQHDAQWIKPGLPNENKILIYNNGRERGYSSVDIIAPPIVTSNFNNYELSEDFSIPYHPQEIFWTYSDTVNFFSHIVSGAQQLPNGNILVCEGINGEVFEVDFFSKNIVWKYILPLNQNQIAIQGDDPGANMMFKTQKFSPSFSAFENISLTNLGPIEIIPDSGFITTSCEIYTSGCTDELAINYNSLALIDDGSCEFSPWNVSNTDCNMTVLMAADMEIVVDGVPVTGPLWVGAFNGAGLCVGSSYVTPGVVNSVSIWGSEPGIEPANGLLPGEEIIWAVFYNGDEVPALVVNSFGENTYSCNGLAGAFILAISSVHTQNITLDPGWNMWSTHISPDDHNMSSVFSSIVSSTIIVKDENGGVYWPQFGLNSIGLAEDGNMIDGEGYKVNMLNAETLTLEGGLVPADTELSFDDGWNMTGYLPLDEMDAAVAMAPVLANMIIMKDENGLVFWPQFGLNNIGNMAPGEGYQLKMVNPQTFSYESNDMARFAYANPVKTIHFDKANNTGSNMIMGLPLYAWSQVPEIGDELAAYDEDGNLVGSDVFEGDHIAMTVWGDDSTTDSKDGVSEAERVTFKLWHSDVDVEESFEVKWDEGSDIYIPDGISVAGSISLTGIDSIASCELYQNVPNPFTGKTSVKFFVPADVEVNISIYNMLGEFVAEVTNEIYQVGEHSVLFEGSELGQGTYFLRMNTESFTRTKHMIIVK